MHCKVCYSIAACAKYKNIFVPFFLYNVNRLRVTMEKDLSYRTLENTDGISKFVPFL